MHAKNYDWYSNKIAATNVFKNYESFVFIQKVKSWMDG